VIIPAIEMAHRSAQLLQGRAVSAAVFGRDCVVAIQMPMNTVTIPATRFQRSGSPSNVAPTS